MEATREVDAEWFRRAWRERWSVRLDLDYRCVKAKIHGKVSYVATTGAFAVVGGWHVPLDAVTARAKGRG